MNDYLKSASERYINKVGKEFLINPISNIDGEIITEIMELFKKLNAYDVVTVLKEYKYKKDEEIRDDLLDLNINFKINNNEVFEYEIRLEDQKKKESSIIIFNDYQKTFLKKSLLLGGKKILFIDKETNAEFPAILINEVDTLATTKPMYANTVLTYEDEEERDDDYNNLISKIK